MQVVAATELADDYLDSTDHIAYQYSNLIQPHVLFFNVDRRTRSILNVSTNVDQWLDFGAADAVGMTISDELFPGIEEVLDAMERRDVKSARVFNRRVQHSDGRPLLCRITSTALRWLVELEIEHHPCDVDVDIQKLEQILLQQVQSLNCESSIQDIVNNTTRQLRELLGYERGMCYQFDEQNNGEVIAEATVTPGAEKYLWLRFPARDIPRTAREMLVASPVRTTLDQSRECNQIYPGRDPETQDYVDLTYVRSRGAAGSCREYYLNMNVHSTYVLPLIVEDRLWGMLAFHDRQIRRVNPKFDERLQSIAKCVSISLERNVRASREQVRRKGLQVVKALSEVDATSNQWLRYIQSRVSDLKELIPCNGFVLRMADEYLVEGTVPSPADRQSFTDQLFELSHGQPLCANRLEQLSADLVRFSRIAAGAIAIPLSADHNDIAIWLRPEQKQTLRWAGDPLGKIQTDTDGNKRLCPRESFELWTRVTENTCLPWTEQELSMASSACMQLGLLTLSWYAAQACQAKTQFLSCMSHEIRTPMTAILGYANLLKEQHRAANHADASDQTDEFIDIIERNGQHLLSVIDDILNLAKIEAGKLTVERIPIEIIELLNDVVSLIKVQADIKQLAFVLALDTPIPKTIYADPVRLRQILLNLLGNAFKFTERGSVSLKVGYEGSTGQIYFDVIDSGIGMTESQVSRLFSAFTQADASTTRRFGGSGLGLQISKNLAQLLGGDIAVRSEPGVGSTFRISVASGCSEPVELIHELAPKGSQADQTQSKNASTVPFSLPKLGLYGLRIMLLEDGEDNQRLLRHILVKAGADVQVFENGKLGVEALTTNGQLDGPLKTPFPFDIVLSDMQMPELDGYSTARLLRQKGCTQPIIALTAFAMEGNDIECLSAGCDDYLSKPVKKEALIEMCAKWSQPMGELVGNARP